MSSSFSRSMRTLQQTSGCKKSLAVVLLLGILFVAWVLWFLITPIPRYESSISASIVNNKRATAFLPAATAHNIAPGYLVLLSVDAFPKAEYGTVMATITNIRPISADGTIEVDLSLQSVPPNMLMQRGLTAQAEISIDHATPAQILISTLQRQVTTGN